MTQDEIIEMAAICGIIPWTKHEHVGGNNFSTSDEGLDGDLASLIQFAKLVAAKEREACAEICDRFQARDVGMQPAECAGAIRARGKA